MMVVWMGVSLGIGYVAMWAGVLVWSLYVLRKTQR